MRALDMQGKMGYAENSWVCRFGGLGTTGLKTLRGDDFKRDCKAKRGERHRCGAYLTYGLTMAWASSKANISWRRRAGATGGGTDASLRWRKIRVITDSWVMAAIMRKEPGTRRPRSAREVVRHRDIGLPVCAQRVSSRDHTEATVEYGWTPAQPATPGHDQIKLLITSGGNSHHVVRSRDIFDYPDEVSVLSE
jgi:hypothetical protein